MLHGNFKSWYSLFFELLFSRTIMTNLIVDEPLNGTFIHLENLSEHHFDGLNEIVAQEGFVYTEEGVKRA